jgi:hypothetical protein
MRHEAVVTCIRRLEVVVASGRRYGGRRMQLWHTQRLEEEGGGA